MVNISSVVMYGFPFFVNQIWGKGGHAEQQTLTFIDVCISVAKHTSASTSPTFVQMYGKQCCIFLLIFTMPVFHRTAHTPVVFYCTF